MKRFVCVLLSVVMTAALCVFPASASGTVTLTYDLMYEGKTVTREYEAGAVPEQESFSREGYDSCRCYSDGGFTEHFDFSKPLTEDKTVYVRWLTEDELVNITVYLDPADEEPTASGEFVRGEVPGQFDAPGREGEYFAGWYRNRQCTVPYNPTEVIIDSFDIYACFADSPDEVTGYRIFDSPQAKTPVVGGFIKKGGTMFFPASPKMDEDQLLEGWFLDRGLTSEMDFSQPVTDSEISLYPSVLGEEEVYWVGLYLDPKDAAPVGYGFVKKGKPVPEPESPSREGERVTGWFTDRALTHEADFVSPNEDDISLFPRWEAIHRHSITELPETAATAATDGCGKHWICTECRKWFYPDNPSLVEIEDHEEMVIPAEGPFVRGDANGDGDINISDVTSIQCFIAEIETEKFCRAAAHVSGSDRLDITDATYIQYYLADLVDTL